MDMIKCESISNHGGTGDRCDQFERFYFKHFIIIIFFFKLLEIINNLEKIIPSSTFWQIN